MDTTTKTPQEAKAEFISALKLKIIESLNYMFQKHKQLSTKFETSSCAPAFGWSVDEYSYMPLVAAELRKEGYIVTSSVNHGVTDWLISA